MKPQKLFLSCPDMVKKKHQSMHKYGCHGNQLEKLKSCQKPQGLEVFDV